MSTVARVRVGVVDGKMDVPIPGTDHDGTTVIPFALHSSENPRAPSARVQSTYGTVDRAGPNMSSCRVHHPHHVVPAMQWGIRARWACEDHVMRPRARAITSPTTPPTTHPDS
jgi:hypothetical protein